MNLPNALTIARLALVPVFAWLYMNAYPIAALTVYVAAALTDALDGYLARRLNQITSIGKLLDPLADKLMQLTMLYCLVSSGHVPMWFFMVLLVKELYMVIGAMVLLRHKVVIQAHMLGKVATVLSIAAILCLYPWHAMEALFMAGRILLTASLVLSVLAVVSYTISAVRAVNEQPSEAQ